MSVPRGIHAIHHDSEIVAVELEKCRDLYAFAYSGDGWHYLCATIKQYLNHKELTADQSILKKYYDKHQPTSLEDYLRSPNFTSQWFEMGTSTLV